MKAAFSIQTSLLNGHLMIVPNAGISAPIPKTGERQVLKLPSGVKRWQSLGRLKAGQLNKTETAYERVLISRKLAGEVIWYRFHPFNVRLADNTHYRPDVLVLSADGHLEIHEIKGSFTSEMGNIKIKLCAEVLPVFRMIKVSKTKAGFTYEEF